MLFILLKRRFLSIYFRVNSSNQISANVSIVWECGERNKYFLTNIFLFNSTECICMQWTFIFYENLILLQSSITINSIFWKRILKEQMREGKILEKILCLACAIFLIKTFSLISSEKMWQVWCWFSVVSVFLRNLLYL